MKRLAKETAVYGLSSIIGRFLNWMLVPMYTRVLTDTSDYGIVTNLYGWTALLLILLTYGMETGFFRFINKKEETEPMRVYASVLYCLMASSTLFVLLVFLFLPQISGGLGYAEHPEYVGMMAGIVAVERSPAAVGILHCQNPVDGTAYRRIDPARARAFARKKFLYAL